MNHNRGALFGSAIRQPLKLIRPHTVVRIPFGALRGKRWIVGSGIHRCWMGLYEFDKQHFVSKRLRPGAIFFDIGANVGFYSLLAADVVQTVYAFEPLPANVEFLRQHLVLNDIRNVRVIEAAVCDQVGGAFFVGEQTRFMGKLDPAGDIRVASLTLDGALENGTVRPPDFIKMDIEGAEFNALMGAQECFRRHRPMLFLATHGEPVHRKCCELLSSWHYEIRDFGKMTQNAHREVCATPPRDQ